MGRLIPLAVILLAVLALGGGAACFQGSDPDVAEPNGPVESAVHSLERLAFVPAGRTQINSPLDVGSAMDLLVDRHEVTVSDWARLFPGDDRIPDAFRGTELADPKLYPIEWTRDVPIVGVTLYDAREAAAIRGMRVPTFEEWLWCAVGPRSRRVPAGRMQDGLANSVELGFGRTTPVGAFESGQTQDTGIYDLLGNVWEWVEPPFPPLEGWELRNSGAWPADGGRSAESWVMGGSFATPALPIFGRDGRLFADAATPGHRSSTIGFRCVVNARPFLRALEATLVGIDLDTPARARLVAVGQAWGPRAVATLERLVDDVGSRGISGALLEGARR